MVEKVETNRLEPELIKDYIYEYFNDSVLPSLIDFVKIPNLSKLYDKNWKNNGYLEQAATHLVNWVHSQNLKGIKCEIIYHKEDNRTPLIYIDVEPTEPGTGTVLYYGHYDKQPHLSGWREGLGPTTPVVENGKLYGRGSVDDGYALYGAISSIKACQDNNLSHPRCIVIIEGDEESEGEDLPYYFDHLKDKIGFPDVIVCLDSGCIDYERFSLTSSLRGIIEGTIQVKVLSEGVHSGAAAGIVPSSFRILRQILERIESSKTGLLDEIFYVDIPKEVYAEAFANKEFFLKSLEMYPFHGNTCSVSHKFPEAYLNKTWFPQLCCIGVDGMPSISEAGNVLRMETSLKVSIRLPPTLNSKMALNALKDLIESNPPYGAEVKFVDYSGLDGWFAEKLNGHLRSIIHKASRNFYKNDAHTFGEGASIPFLKVLADRYPEASFIVTGLGGMDCCAHGPNECLDIEGAKKLFCSLTQVLNELSFYLKRE